MIKIAESGVYIKGEINILSIIGEMLSEGLADDVGSFMTFVGIVKKVGKAEKEVSKVQMEAYEGPANNIIKKICEEIKEKYKLSIVKIFHFVGSFKIGEPLVLILVTGSSRTQTIPALEEAISRYKTEPFIYKKEIYVDGTQEWISGD